MTFSSKQLVIGFESIDKAETLLSVASLSATASKVFRPQRIFVSFSWESFVISIDATWSHQQNYSVLLNPSSGNASLYLLWESWQLEADNPQIQMRVECDCIYLDIGPRHILAINAALRDFFEVLSRLKHNVTAENPYSSSHEKRQSPLKINIHDQHYKDDLQSGAFQFVDGLAEELPFPYQVITHDFKFCLTSFCFETQLIRNF